MANVSPLALPLLRSRAWQRFDSTVALIVTTLTGLPVVPAICLSWCGEQKTTTQYCHDEAVGDGLAVITLSGNV